MSFVYFIRNKKSGRIKIGYSHDPVARLAALQTGSASRLELIGYVAGGRKTECLMHELLSEHRVDGEWFLENYPVKDFVRICLSRGQSEAIAKYESIYLQRQESISRGEACVHPHSNVRLQSMSLWEAMVFLYRAGLGWADARRMAEVWRCLNLLKRDSAPSGMTFGFPIPIAARTSRPEPTP